MKIFVRRMKISQLFRAMSLDQKCFPNDAPLGRQLKNGVTILAWIDDLALGYGHLTDQGTIDRIGVIPQCRRQGVGQAILKALIRYAKRLNYSTLASYAARDNIASNMLFLTCGFQPRCSKTWINWSKTFKGK